MTLPPAWTESLGTNFTVQDVVGSLAAVAAFALVLYGPGYSLAWAVNLYGFRRRSLAERSCWAVVCSFGLTPVAAYLVGRMVGLVPFCWVSVAMGIASLLLVYRIVPRGLVPRASAEGNSTVDAVPLEGQDNPRSRWWVVSLAALWIAFVLVSLLEVQVGKRLYFSVAMFDQSYRVAFTDAVARTGVPPANPLYFPGHAAPLRYYYFWYVLCAAVMKIAGVTARQAFVASSVWAGFGLVAMIALYLRHFFGVARGLRRQVVVAVGLLLVTGADLLPAIGSLFAQKAVNGEMEWWSEDQISSWMDSLLWVPHHVASLLCCLLSFLLLWRTREPWSGRRRWVAAAMAGVAFASGFGLSIYVAFGMALLIVAWVVKLCVSRAKNHFLPRMFVARRPKTTALVHQPGPFDVASERRASEIQETRALGMLPSLAVSGIVAAVLLAPFLRELSAGQGSGGPVTEHVFALSVRRFIDPELLTGLTMFASWHATHPIVLDYAMRLVLLLPGLALELGFYGVALLLVWRVKDEAGRVACYLAVCGLVMVAFIRSAVIGNNDFGYRAALLPQFFLLLQGVRLVAAWWMGEGVAPVAATRLKRGLLVGLMVLGVAGTVYQAAMLRVFLPLEAARADSGFAGLPEDAFEARKAFAAMRRVAPLGAVVQFNAVSTGSDAHGDVVPPRLFYERALLLDSGRQVLNAESECAVEFGGDAGPCAAMKAATTALYGAPSKTAGWAEGYCRGFGVGYLAAGHNDAAWRDRAGWVWTLPVAAAEPGFRILKCSPEP